METSLRYDCDSRALVIHAKEKIAIDSKTHLQVHGELDTKIGVPCYLSAVMRRFYPDLSASLGFGLHYNGQEKFRYSMQGKKAFPVTTNGLLSFNIKGRYDIDKEFKERTPSGAAEFTLGILNFQKDQDVRLKVGCEVIQEKAIKGKKVSKVFNMVPYLQIRENNWTLNADINGKWNVSYDL
ncbi:outer envelope pore protein 21B, chloroplastic-like isoform X1 [Cornus florida]|uniref:outer envelope pore protein 21B, chloroplastic-like isoform X1 n=1 Tax=Cornus florida TaxID=4283 RepID=UPI002899B569|nr:outer envelope pore protein 21B, chloroplastic-like isoform X1 [Cornus florida]XP_059636539.1 outer envelope pore protein 21B, chloroplastic-like isoform X1 [Cornus florida]